MSLVLAAAAGLEAVADLRRLAADGTRTGKISWVAHDGRAVAWAADNPWVSSSDDGAIVVVVDGHVHNRFGRGASDAAFVHARYARVGDDFGRDLMGDFVAVVLDRTRDRILVARDPLGVRPWYQATSGRRHSGATDVATLCHLPWVDDSVDEAVALAYLAGITQSRGPTFHQGISTLMPGTTWSSSGEGIRVRRHHEWDIAPEPEVGWEEAVHRCRQVIDEAVRCRLPAIGAATSELSGGLDSSAIVGTAVQLGAQDLVVGRLLFDGAEADERAFSDAVIKYWDLQAVSVGPWLPSEQESIEMTAALRRPPPAENFTMFATLHRALRREGRPNGFDGVGGDDVFQTTSYESRVISAVQQRQLDTLGPILKADLRHPRQGWRRTWRPTLRYLSPRGRRRPPRFISARAARIHGLEARLAQSPQRVTGVRAIDARMDGLTSGYLANVLEDAAIVSDQVGWRASHPYLDPHVIKALYGLNPWFPVRNGYDRALQLAAFGDRLPPAVRDRRSKAEFSEVVFARALTGDALDHLLKGPLGYRGWLEEDAFTALLGNAKMGMASAAIPISRALALHRWLDQLDS